MPIPDDVNRDKLAEVALAVLSLGAFDDGNEVRAWKGMDWDVLALLHERGWISDPGNKHKSVSLSDDGARSAERFVRRHLGRDEP